MNQPLVSHRFPYIRLTVELRGTVHTVDALLDTGFDGDIVLPPDMIGAGLPPDSELRCRLADDSEVMAPLYFGAVRVLGSEDTPAIILALGNEVIVGLGVSNRFSITLDHGQRVVVEP